MAKQSISLVDLKPKPRNDAYTGLLAISLVAMMVACVLLWLDLKQYPTIKPGSSDSPAPRLTQPTEPPPAPAGPGAPGAVPVPPAGDPAKPPDAGAKPDAGAPAKP